MGALFGNFVFGVALVMSGVATPASAEVDLNECYGETLGVSLRTEASEEGEVLRQETFSLPFPSAWLVNVERDQLLHDVPCMPEPIEAIDIWGDFQNDQPQHAGDARG